MQACRTSSNGPKLYKWILISARSSLTTMNSCNHLPTGPANDSTNYLTQKSNSEGRDEVLENARRERAQREKARASRGQAITIQRWYRGRSAAVRCRAKERADWDRKISDFGKLQRTLVARWACIVCGADAVHLCMSLVVLSCIVYAFSCSMSEALKVDGW